MYASNITVNDHTRIWQDLTTQLAPFRDDMFRNINYVNGFQYTAEDLQYLAYHKRLPVVWNIILPKILAYTGAERSNRIMARAEAVEQNDLEMANLINLLIEQDNEETRANWNISLSAMHAAIFRYGVLMQTWEKTNKYPEGQYMLKAIDPRDVWFDPHPSEMDFDNSNYMIYSRWYTPEHIIKKYATTKDQANELEEKAAHLEGNKSGKLKERTYAERYRAFTTPISKRDKERFSEEGGTYTHNGAIGIGYGTYRYNGMYRVVELHQKETTNVLYVVDPVRGESVKVPDKLNKDREFIGRVLKERGLDERALSWQLEDLMTISASAPDLSDKILYNRPYPVQGEGYMLKIIPGYNLDPDRRNLRSIVDMLIDPQDLVNRDLSSRALMMNKMLNPDIYLGPTALDDDEQLAQIKKQGSGKIINMGNLDDFKIQYPNLSGMNMFTQSANDAMAMSEETPGISKNMMGMKESSDESGKLVQVRAGLSEAMLTLLFDNIANAIVSVEKYHLAMIQKHMTLKRMVRTIGVDGETEFVGAVNEYNPKLNIFKNDVTIGKYDIRINKTKFTRSERQGHLNKLVEILQMADAESRVDIFPEIYQLLDTPQGKALESKAKERSAIMALRRKAEALELEQQIKVLENQGELQPEMEDIQAINVDTQKKSSVLQNQQVTTAIEAQAAQKQMSEGAGQPIEGQKLTEEAAQAQIKELGPEGTTV